MTDPRIIRTGASGSRACDSVELNFQDIEKLGRQVLREAMEKARAVAVEKEELEKEIRLRKEGVEAEYAAQRLELEEELRVLRETIDDERDSAHREGFEAGKKAAHDQGFSDGHRIGFEKGYADGRAAGCRDGRDEEAARIQRETSTLVDTIAAVAGDLSRRRGELFQAAKAELIHLAVKVAEKIVQNEIALRGDVVLVNLRRATEQIFQQSKVVIQLNSEDLDVVEKYSREAIDAFDGLRDFELVAVDRIDRGGCRVLAGAGEVDLSIETQLKVIERALVEAGARHSLAASLAAENASAASSPAAAPAHTGGDRVPQEMPS